MVEHKRKIPVINISFTILIYKNPKEIQDRFPDSNFDVDLDSFNGGLFTIDEKIYICFLDDGSLTHGMIAHECNHLLNEAYSIIGQRREMYNDELDCYFLQWLIDCLNEVYLPTPPLK